MSLQSIPAIFHSDIGEIKNLLAGLKSQLERLNAEIIDFRQSQMSTNPITDFVFGVVEDVVVDYVSSELPIKKRRTRPLTRNALDRIRNQKYDPDLPEP
ncbi:MAG: hypothetical protein IH840_14560 [Candidatus Heimdallarchaeota archaeon]|nr:hypothetical protein [Candidatus Heimdallarchaeota archaeon]